MKIKSLGALLLAVAFSLGHLPAYAVQQTSSGVQYLQTGSQLGVYSGGNASVPVDYSGTASAPALISVTTSAAINIGDTLTFSLGLTKPANSTVTLSDMNGATAGATAIATNTGNNAAINDGSSSLALDGIYTVTFSSSVTSGTTITLGTIAIDPDIPGVYSVALDATDATGILISGATKVFKAQAYEVLTPTATQVQSASFATGVDLDADGNVYWANLGGLVYKTTPSGVTSTFANLGAVKLFVDGSYLFGTSDLGLIRRIPLSNTNPNAQGTIVRQHTSKSYTYAQNQSFFRISGKNYISWNIYHSGELWEYKDPEDRTPTFKSLTGNQATLEFADHNFAVGDTLNVSSVGAPFDGTSHVITSITSTTVTYSVTNANIARTAATGTVYNATSTMLSGNVNGAGTAIRGMAPSLDNSKIYLADPTKRLLEYNFANQQISTTFSLAGVDYAPNDVTILGDGSFLFSTFSTGGYLWHFDAAGNPLHKIRVFTTSLITNGYDLRIAPDGSAIYLAAQSSGFIKIPLSPGFAGRNYGVSTPIQPPAGTPKVVTATPANVLSTSVDNVSFSSATLAGTVNANGTSSNAYFQISSDPTFPAGSTTTTANIAISGNSDTPISQGLNTLTPGTTYYYKLLVNSGGTVIEGAVRSFSTLIPPAVTSTTVSAGPAVGGTAVTLTGNGLAAPTDVRVGATSLSTYTATSTQVQLTTPAQTGTNISVTTATGVAVATFTYDSPTIASVSSATGNAGDRITLRGLNLTGVTGISLNGTAMTGLIFVDDTEVSAVVPSGTGSSLSFVLTTPSGSVTRAASFSYNSQQQQQQQQQQPTNTAPDYSNIPVPLVSGANLKYLFTKTNYTITLFGTNMAQVVNLSAAGRVASIDSQNEKQLTATLRKVTSPGIVNLDYSYLQGSATIAGALEFFDRPTPVYIRNVKLSSYASVQKSALRNKSNKAVSAVICVSRAPSNSSQLSAGYSAARIASLCKKIANSFTTKVDTQVIQVAAKPNALPNGSLWIGFK